MRYAFLLSCALLLSAQSRAAGDHRPAADLIIQHAKVWTVNAAQPEAQAVAVLGERIVFVGSDSAATAWRGPNTQVIDAQGHRLLPGFNDAHVHFSDGGAALKAVQLNDAASLKEFVRRIAEYAARLPAGEWMRNGDWDELKWSPANLPTRQDIDAASGGHSVSIDRYDGHAILVNSQVLKLAGISAATPDPPGGVIVHDATGEPTGVLKDAAINLVAKLIPPLTHAQRRRAIEDAQQEAARLGVTSIQDMSEDYADIAVYSELLREGKLTVRVYGAPLIETVDDQAKLGIGHAFGGSSLRIGALKMFADGSLGSRTAYFFEPFDDQPQNRGLLAEDMLPLARTRERLLRADSTGLQVCTHAIGDAGISTVLDLYAEIDKLDGPRDRRWRIEHAQHMAAKDFDRFAQLNVIASVQPTQEIDDARWAEKRIGKDRASRTYPFKTFLDRGVRIAFGTDWPVVSFDPLLGLYAATTRATLDGKQPEGWFPEQKISIRDAIAAYTTGSAYAEFQEHDKGSIEPGKLADLVLLDQDILQIAPATIRSVHVLKTWMGGKQIFGASAGTEKGL
jgi:predicted amidohydrolase YtcJ